MNTNQSTFPAGLQRLGQSGTAIAVVGALGLAVGFAMAPKDPGHLKPILTSYLFGWVFAMLFALGSYGFMLLHFMVKGSWGKPVIRMFEAGAKSLPIMGLLFIPILLGYKALYPWATPGTDATLIHRAPWMNITFFTLRTIIYFGIWAIFTKVLTDSSKRQDVSHDPAEASMRQQISAIGFLIFVVSITLAFTDWVMSLDAHWFSTIYGGLFLDYMGLASISLVSIIICRYKIAQKPPYEELVDKQQTRDLGNLMLMLTMIWAYFSLSQWLITWSGNLPEEVQYYLTRNTGGFLIVGALNIIFSFFAPFLALLSGRTRRTPQILTSVAYLIIVMRVWDLFWVLIPASGRVQVIPTDVAGLAFGFGAFLALFGAILKQNQLIPEHSEKSTEEVLAHV